MHYERSLDGYLILKPKGYYGLSARMTSKAPALAKDEIAVQLKVRVPDSLFKRPQLQASITVPESSVSAPVISAAVLDNVKQVLSEQTGLDIQIAVIEPTQVA